MAPGILSAKGVALGGTLAAPAPSQPLAMAVDPVVSSFGLELPSSLRNRIAGLRTAYTTLDVQLGARIGCGTSSEDGDGCFIRAPEGHGTHHLMFYVIACRRITAIGNVPNSLSAPPYVSDVRASSRRQLTGCSVFMHTNLCINALYVNA